MKLDKKKALASKVFGIGKKRIVFLEPRLGEIKEAITKEDLRVLEKEGAIVLKDKKGRLKNKSKTRKSPGNIRKYVVRRKKDYMILTRKLRGYVSELKKQGRISNEDFKEIRKKIRNRNFKSKNHLKEYLGGKR